MNVFVKGRALGHQTMRQAQRLLVMSLLALLLTFGVAGSLPSAAPARVGHAAAGVPASSQLLAAGGKNGNINVGG